MPGRTAVAGLVALVAPDAAVVAFAAIAALVALDEAAVLDAAVAFAALGVEVLVLQIPPNLTASLYQLGLQPSVPVRRLHIHL